MYFKKVKMALSKKERTHITNRAKHVGLNLQVARKRRKQQKIEKAPQESETVFWIRNVLGGSDEG
jgi:hypothetical protein